VIHFGTVNIKKLQIIRETKRSANTTQIIDEQYVTTSRCPKCNQNGNKHLGSKWNIDTKSRWISPESKWKMEWNPKANPDENPSEIPNGSGTKNIEKNMEDSACSIEKSRRSIVL
jgi:hypothetical protein